MMATMDASDAAALSELTKALAERERRIEGAPPPHAPRVVWPPARLSWGSGELALALVELRSGLESFNTNHAPHTPVCAQI